MPLRRSSRSLGSALGICAGFALLEGLLSGSDAAARYASMRLPAGSPPFWGWIVIGAGYYAIVFTVLYRLLSLPDAAPRDRTAALGLVFVLMSINALWSLAFFGGKPFAAVLLLAPYDLAALSLLVLLARLDRLAASTFSLYVLYLAYATLWAYRVWQANAI